MYGKGNGVPQDYKAAAKWWRLAAEQGFAMAESNLEVMYQAGTGVIQDNVYALYRSLKEFYFVSCWSSHSLPAFWALSSSKARVMSGATGRSSAMR